MKSRLFVIAALCLAAAGCQSGNTKAKMEWVQFQYGDVFDVADAKCKLFAQTQQQGIYAQGSTSFVVGAQLGNAIGNAIRMEQAYKQCMTIAGWKQQPVASVKAIASAQHLPMRTYAATCLPAAAVQPNTATVRTVAYDGTTITLGGKYHKQTLPKRALPCQANASGLFCQVQFEGTFVTATVSGSRLVETVVDANGRPIASVSYQCDKSLG